MCVQYMPKETGCQRVARSGCIPILVTFQRLECKRGICQLRTQIYCYECNTSVAREITGEEKERLLKTNRGAWSFV